MVLRRAGLRLEQQRSDMSCGRARVPAPAQYCRNRPSPHDDLIAAPSPLRRAPRDQHQVAAPELRAPHSGVPPACGRGLPMTAGRPHPKTGWNTSDQVVFASPSSIRVTSRSTQRTFLLGGHTRLSSATVVPARVVSCTVTLAVHSAVVLP